MWFFNLIRKIQCWIENLSNIFDGDIIANSLLITAIALLLLSLLCGSSLVVALALLLLFIWAVACK